MIVRTYGRRSRGISRTYSDTNLNDAVHADEDDDVIGSGDDPFGISLSQPAESTQDTHLYSSLNFSSQESYFDSEPYVSNNALKRLAFGGGAVGRQPKKAKTGQNLRLPPTSTLMEAQEFGEMMEHVDEVNFALDGLRAGQPVRIRRASLLSLLSICGTAQQRRLLRTQG